VDIHMSSDTVVLLSTVLGTFLTTQPESAA